MYSLRYTERMTGQLTPEEVEAALIKFGEKPETALAVREAFDNPTEVAFLRAMEAVFGSTSSAE